MIKTEARGWRRWSSRGTWIAATLVALVVLYVGLNPSTGEREDAGAPEVAHSLVIAAPQPGEAMRILPARQHQTVTLRIRSDRAGEIHVHGYDQNAILKADSEVVLSFVAKASGIYPIHLHERASPEDPDSPILHRQLAVIEVKAE